MGRLHSSSSFRRDGKKEILETHAKMARIAKQPARRTPIQKGSVMKSPLRIVLVLFLIVVSIPATLAQRRSVAHTVPGDVMSTGSYARAHKVLEDGINALGGLEAIRAVEDVKLKVRGFSYARNQSLSVNPPYDKMTRDEDLFIDLKNRRFIIETRDPLPGGFVFGGKQVI